MISSKYHLISINQIHTSFLSMLQAEIREAQLQTSQVLGFSIRKVLYLSLNVTCFTDSWLFDEIDFTVTPLRSGELYIELSDEIPQDGRYRLSVIGGIEQRVSWDICVL